MFDGAEERLQRVEAACSARDAGLLEVALTVADAIGHGAFAAAGLGHGPAWLRAYTESSRDDAGRAVSLGRLLACHPATRHAVESGGLSISRAAVLAGAVTNARRVAYRDTEETLLAQVSAVHRVEDVETLIAHWCALVDQDTTPGADRAQRLYLQHRFDGGASVRGELNARTTEAVRAGLDTFDTGPDPVNGPLPARTLAERRADALGDLAGYATQHATGSDPDDEPSTDDKSDTRDAQSAPHHDDKSGTGDAPSAPDRDESGPGDEHPDDDGSGTGDASPSPADRSRPAPARRSSRTTNLVIDLPSLAGRTPTDLDGIIATLDGRHLAAWAAQELLCDTWIAALLTNATGAVIDATERIADFTDTQRRLIATRDRHCVFPGCDAPPSWCDVHHLHWKTNGGGRPLDNGALLCRRHHTLIHQVGPKGNRWTLHRSPDSTGWHATSPTGTTWTGRPNDDRQSTGKQPGAPSPPGHEPPNHQAQPAA